MSITIQTGRAQVATVEELLGKDARSGEAFQRQLSILAAASLIREMRDQAGLSQDQLARKLGMRQSRISELERGKGEQGPTITTLARIARACNVRLAISLGPKASAKEIVLHGDDGGDLRPVRNPVWTIPASMT